MHAMCKLSTTTTAANGADGRVKLDRLLLCSIKDFSRTATHDVDVPSLVRHLILRAHRQIALFLSLPLRPCTPDLAQDCPACPTFVINWLVFVTVSSAWLA